MISERAAITRAGAVRARSGVPSWRARWTAHPAIAGRERLAQVFGQSVLGQLMLAMSFVALAALLYMVQASQVSVQQINITTLKTERVGLVTADTNYQATAANLQAIQRIHDAATTQLQMANPDPASMIWITPSVPAVPEIRSVNVDTASAQRSSQPLAWMEHAVRFVRSAL